MKTILIKRLLPILSIAVANLSQADSSQTGLYFAGDNLESVKAEQQGMGTGLKTLGVDLMRNQEFTPSVDRYFSLGVGLTFGDDRDSYEQNVQYGGSGATFSEESSISGASVFGDLGLSKAFNEKNRAFVGLGAGYYFLRREISDCTGCKVEKINLALAPYTKIGFNLCGESSCFDISYRYYLSDDYAQGIALSWRRMR